jgi:predicted DNA binding CopG/RHH family protein
MSKSTFIQIRISKEEKEKIKQEAKKRGFDTISAFILWLFRKSAR